MLYNPRYHHWGINDKRKKGEELMEKYFDNLEEVKFWLEASEEEARMKNKKFDLEMLEEAEDMARMYDNGYILNFIAAIYFEGNGLKVNKRKAVELYKEASDIGFYEATSNLGFCYYYGNGVRKDLKKAFEYFTKADDRGSFEGAYMSADMFMKGEFVSKDEKHAFFLYQKCFDILSNNYNESNYAFQQDYSAVCLRLAKCYMFEKGVKKNLSKAEYYNSIAKYFYEKRSQWNDYYCKRGLAETNKLQLKILEERIKIKPIMN